ncbi:MAG TPA: ribonuclease III [Chlamydiales bacterium]|nr:ribonuclease III [Chlamydiales bacterium]
MISYDDLVQKLPELESRLGYTFAHKKHLIRAFLHSSFLNETKRKELKHNECLEFLGDSVLNLIAADELFHLFPEMPEGELSCMRSAIVSAPTCTLFIQHLGVEQYLVVGKGEQLFQNFSHAKTSKSSLFADLFEAILGAIYLDGGLEKAKEFFRRHATPIMTEILQKPSLNSKAKLQELTQKKRQLIPVYKVLEQHGPDHRAEFTVGVFIGDELMGKGKGTSKKEAEQGAAKIALDYLEGQNR